MFNFSKKSWFSLVGGLAISGAALANTSTVTPFASHYYIEAGAGYALTHYEDADSSKTWNNVSNKNGGATYTAEVGYSFRPYLSFDAGGGGLPTAQYDIVGGPKGAKTSSWYLYAGSRVNTTFSQKYSLYSKVGGMLRFLTYDKTDGSDYYFAPMVGCGIRMKFSQNYLLAAEYDYLAGDYSTDKSKLAAHINLFVLKLGYNFS